MGEQFRTSLCIFNSFLFHGLLIILVSWVWTPLNTKVVTPQGISIVYNATPSNTMKEKKDSPQPYSRKIRKKTLTKAKMPVLIKKKKIQDKHSLQTKKVRKKNKGTPLVGQVNGKKKIALKDQYLFDLKILIEENKAYPKAAQLLGQQGLVKIQFKIKPTGEFADIALANECPYHKLNQAALKLIRKIQRFKPLPNSLKETQLAVVLPIEYILN